MSEPSTIFFLAEFTLIAAALVAAVDVYFTQRAIRERRTSALARG